MASSELASTYAALILADDGLEITVRSCCETAVLLFLVIAVR